VTTDLRLRVVGFLCASASLVSLVLHAAGFLPLSLLLNVLGAPALVLLLITGARARRIDAHVFLNRLVAGVGAGIAATAVYDVARLAMVRSGLFDYNPFISHGIFGHLITGRPTDDPVALAAGWAYHLWNGVGIAVMYTLIAGRAHAKYAVGWAMAMEAAWLVTVPSVINVKPHVQLVVVSIIGHLAYGAALGWAARRWVRA
jgi:hypothetical protein